MSDTDRSLDETLYNELSSRYAPGAMLASFPYTPSAQQEQRYTPFELQKSYASAAQPDFTAGRQPNYTPGEQQNYTPYPPLDYTPRQQQSNAPGSKQNQQLPASFPARWEGQAVSNFQPPPVNESAEELNYTPYQPPGDSGSIAQPYVLPEPMPPAESPLNADNISKKYTVTYREILFSDPTYSRYPLGRQETWEVFDGKAYISVPARGDLSEEERKRLTIAGGRVALVADDLQSSPTNELSVYGPYVSDLPDLTKEGVPDGVVGDVDDDVRWRWRTPQDLYADVRINQEAMMRDYGRLPPWLSPNRSPSTHATGQPAARSLSAASATPLSPNVDMAATGDSSEPIRQLSQTALSAQPSLQALSAPDIVQALANIEVKLGDIASEMRSNRNPAASGENSDMSALAEEFLRHLRYGADRERERRGWY